jgi:hypothetical protein
MVDSLEVRPGGMITEKRGLGQEEWWAEPTLSMKGV